jgi:hypothetical protein
MRLHWILALSIALAVGSTSVRAQDDIFDELDEFEGEELEDVLDAVELDDLEGILDLGDVDIDVIDVEVVGDVEVDISGEVDDVDVEGDFPEVADAADLVDADDVAMQLELDRPASRPRHPARDVERLLYDRASRRRASAARAIGNQANPLGAGILTTALRDRTATVRRAAAEALAKVGDFAALGALRRALAREPDTRTQRSMDRAIGTLQGRLYADAGEPITLVCHSCGRTFCLQRKTRSGYCPYDGEPWKLP